MDQWWALPREMRQLMAARVTAANAIERMTYEDMRPPEKGKK